MMRRRAVNFYQILGVQPEVTALEIKRAYRKLAKSHHPDVTFHTKTDSQRDQDNEFMARVNEAYETLIDKSRRAAYDSIMSAGEGRSIKGRHPIVPSEDEDREAYLRHIFHPARTAMVRVMAKYQQQLSDLSQDIYDEELVGVFEKYVEEVENTLRKASNDLSKKAVPSSLRAGVQMMRYAIAQAVDGLEELQRFCQNYDYQHLHMAVNLFKEASNLCRNALQLTKV